MRFLFLISVDLSFWITTGIFSSGVGAQGSKVKVIEIGGLLPSDSRRLFSMGRMKPAATIALEYVQRKQLLNDTYRLTISYKDSKCSESEGMNEAINFYIQRNVRVFFGPVCDYAAAPVARQITFWNLPMVSVGTIAKDFATRRKEVYPFLTRAGPSNVHPLGDALVTIMRTHNWKKIKLLYQKLAYSNILTHVCPFAVEAIIDNVKLFGLSRDYYDMGTKLNAEEVLRNEIGNDYGGMNTRSA